MRYLLSLLLMAATSLMLNAQEIEKIDAFDQLNVAGPFEINLIKSNEYKIKVDRHGFSRDEVEIEERAGELSFRIRTKSLFDADFDRDEYVEVDIYFVELEDIRVSMGATLTSKDVVETDFLSLEVSMGGNMEINAAAQEIDIKVTMGGEAKISGNAKRGYFSTNMGGEILARELFVEEANAKVNMGGIIFISVEKEIDASANLGGVINYYGDPEYVDTSINLGGEIRHRGRLN